MTMTMMRKSTKRRKRGTRMSQTMRAMMTMPRRGKEAMRRLTPNPRTSARLPKRKMMRTIRRPRRSVLRRRRHPRQRPRLRHRRLRRRRGRRRGERDADNAEVPRPFKSIPRLLQEMPPHPGNPLLQRGGSLRQLPHPRVGDHVDGSNNNDDEKNSFRNYKSMKNDKTCNWILRNRPPLILT